MSPSAQNFFGQQSHAELLTPRVEVTPPEPHRESSPSHRHQPLLDEGDRVDVKFTIDAHLSSMQLVTVNAHLTDSSLACDDSSVSNRPNDSRSVSSRTVTDADIADIVSPTDGLLVSKRPTDSLQGSHSPEIPESS